MIEWKLTSTLSKSVSHTVLVFLCATVHWDGQYSVLMCDPYHASLNLLIPYKVKLHKNSFHK